MKRLLPSLVLLCAAFGTQAAEADHATRSRPRPSTEVLKDGAIPLEVLEAKIDRWIAANK